MKRTHDLSALSWTVEGHTPWLWKFQRVHQVGFTDEMCVDVPAVPARVPGSVQGALRDAGILPDWNIEINYRACEWVENRHWIYRTHLPDAWLKDACDYRLECLGLDYCGWVYVNGVEVGAFTGTHIPHTFDLTPHLKPSGNVLEIIFDLPPRWLGQFGYTSRMREWKPRYNYTWDWVPRLLQVGIWDTVTVVATDGKELGTLRVLADADPRAATGILDLQGEGAAYADCDVDVTLEGDAGVIRREKVAHSAFVGGLHWRDLPVNLWWPNLEGEQPLYTLTVRLLSGDRELDRDVRRVGFKHVEWRPCAGAPASADPWLCVVNDKPIFLQGVNCAPLSALFADLTREAYAARLSQYRDLGANVLRINACQFLELPWFWELCDELGLMVWQEYPLTSSGIDNWAPEDEQSITAVADIARSFVRRRRHHASLLLWSGGNELQGALDGNKEGIGKPCDMNHPMLKRLGEVTAEEDPIHRYIPTSPSGPRGGANPADFGKGLHWDVHGGAALAATPQEAQQYLDQDDALLRSEVYCPGASPADLIVKYAGDMAPWPPRHTNPYWSRLTTWWNDWDRLVVLHGREPADLDEYVAWSQEKQALMLGMDCAAAKRRFPGCGGWLLWSGHDTYPLCINSSLIDYDGGLKLSALEMKHVWHRKAGL